MILRWLRRLFLIAFVAVVFGAIGYAITLREVQDARRIYDLRVTIAVETAVYGALYDATRTAESGLPQYRLIRLGDNEALADVAKRYNTTIDVLRMANGLQSNVDYGSGEELVVPQNVLNLNPPRRFTTHVAVAGDTLSSLAASFDVPLTLLQHDNPVLAIRGIIPGDIVFIPRVIS